MTERAGYRVDVRELSAGDLAGVAGLCERALTLDRDAGTLPTILAPRPHVGLVAASGPRLLGACFGSAGQGQRYAGFCAYGVNRLHETGPLGTSPDLRGLGIGGTLISDAWPTSATAACAPPTWPGPGRCHTSRAP